MTLGLPIASQLHESSEFWTDYQTCRSGRLSNTFIFMKIKLRLWNGQLAHTAYGLVGLLTNGACWLGFRLVPMIPVTLVLLVLAIPVQVGS